MNIWAISSCLRGIAVAEKPGQMMPPAKPGVVLKQSLPRCRWLCHTAAGICAEALTCCSVRSAKSILLRTSK